MRIALLLAALLLACATPGIAPAPAAPAPGPAPESGAEPGRQGPDPARGGGLGDFSPAPDRSLTLRQYVDRGFPPADRAWVGADYRRAAELLGALVATDPLLVPRRGSARSGALFARLASPGDQPAAGGATGELRRQHAFAVVQEYPPVFLAYVKAHAATQGGLSAELADLTRAMFQAARAAIEGVESLQAPPSGPRREQFMDAWAKVQAGAAEMVLGAVRTAAEPEALAPVHREQLAAFLADEVDWIFPYLSRKSRADLPGYIERAAATTELPAVRQRLLVFRRRMLEAPAPYW